MHITTQVHTDKSTTFRVSDLRPEDKADDCITLQVNASSSLGTRMVTVFLTRDKLMAIQTAINDYLELPE